MNLEKAASILHNDGVVVFPTETVYGLGARLFSVQGIQKIYSVKGRPEDNPLIVHISNLEQLALLTENVPLGARKIIRKFWPGPLTIVCHKSALVPKSVTAGLDTVAIRMPQHPVARKLIDAVGEPIAAPSANRSGRPSPTRYNDVVKELGEDVDLILDGGSSRIGLESTVIDVTKIPFTVLRPGFITLEEMKKVFPKISAGKNHLSSGRARSPGMKHRHYQPACKVVLVEPGSWRNEIAEWSRKSSQLGVLSFARRIPQSNSIIFSKTILHDEDYAKNLYKNFFEAEKKSVDVLLVEKRAGLGLGAAIMDRLTRASSK